MIVLMRSVAVGGLVPPVRLKKHLLRACSETDLAEIQRAERGYRCRQSAAFLVDDNHELLWGEAGCPARF